MPGDIKRSVTIAGHRTSITLEPEFWSALKEMACTRKISVNELVRKIDETRNRADPRGLSSEVRVHILRHFKDATACDTTDR
ncbi:ribbon-helix-helix domain-containing protein [Pyruvatibacter sp.]|uniref:ribbon-helix-helix domain-containing protein n=1 Tax=Pyruvatibacter sp. TaxID=1981328 RepID=UPI0032EF98DC